MNANGRRAKQAANRFSHWAPRQRPNYKIKDAATSARHLDKVKRTEQRIKQGKKK